MGLGRRNIALEDASAWVFNRMANVYSARPAYPAALVDMLAELAGDAGSRIGDIGAGIGHLALPLAARGFEVSAVEPAEAMLAQLRHAATKANLSLRSYHAAAESLPFADDSLDLVIVADALHFMDAEWSAREIRRVLRPGGALALVTCDLGDTPFMRGLIQCMRRAAPRRPRDLTAAVAQVAAVSGVTFTQTHCIEDETPVDEATLESILRSISFIGPAMNPERFAAFRQQITALPGSPTWARCFTVRAGRRRGR